MPIAGFSTAEARRLVEHYVAQGESAAKIVLAAMDKTTSEEERITDGLRATINRAIEQSQANSVLNRGVVCLCETHTDILMWAHYADGHRGMCLAFDATLMPFAGAHQVRYAETLPQIDVLRMLAGTLAPHELASSMMLTKYSAWSYEREWRMLTSRGRQPLNYPVSALQAVYLGIAIPEDSRKKVAEALGKSGVPLIQMKRGLGGFAVQTEC
jgi:hypothetical protein